VEHLIAQLIVHEITPFLGRWFFRTICHWPAVFAAVALVGECVGVWAIGFWPLGDWFWVGIRVLCLFLYTGLLALLAVKLWSGTWGAFCDWGVSLFE
jgi:hypothetical protein